MTWPNVYLLGAPKCGTTSLADGLDQHPDARVVAGKEPHFFYNPYGDAPTEDAYRRLASAGTQAVVVDASVWYLFSDEAVPRILDVRPDARFLVCLRNPVEMAPSLHAQKLDTGHERYEAFADAWRVRAARRSGKLEGVIGIPEGDARHMDYFGACALGTQLERLYQQVAPSHVHVVWLDDVRANAEETLAAAYAFLGLDPSFHPETAHRNKATARRSPLIGRALVYLSQARRKIGLPGGSGLLAPLHRWNRVERAYPALSDALQSELREAFEPEISKLEAITGRDLSAWRAPATG